MLRKAIDILLLADSEAFSEEYRLVHFVDLHGQNGASASVRWFSNKGFSEKVHVATSFGLLVGILRSRTLENCPFIKSKYFESVKCLLNSKAFERDYSAAESPEIFWLKAHVAAIKDQLASASREILKLRQEIKSSKDDFDLPTPPSTPSPPKSGFLPPKRDGHGPDTPQARQVRKKANQGDLD